MHALRMFFLLGMVMLLPFLVINSQNLEDLELKEGSKIWLKGETNISRYLCSIDSFKLEADGTFRHESDNKDSLVIQPDHLSLTLYVSYIQCGNKMMNRDVHEALNYPDERKIVYTYKGLNSLPEIQNINSWNTLKIKGLLEINNIKNKAIFPVKVMHLDKHQFHVKGKHTIDMIQYDVRPPSKLNGLIKASEKLTVHFDVVIGSKS